MSVFLSFTKCWPGSFPFLTLIFFKKNPTENCDSSMIFLAAANWLLYIAV